MLLPSALSPLSIPRRVPDSLPPRDPAGDARNHCTASAWSPRMGEPGCCATMVSVGAAGGGHPRDPPPVPEGRPRASTTAERRTTWLFFDGAGGAGSRLLHFRRAVGGSRPHRHRQWFAARWRQGGASGPAPSTAPGADLTAARPPWRCGDRDSMHALRRP